MKRIATTGVLCLLLIGMSCSGGDNEEGVPPENNNTNNPTPNPDPDTSADLSYADDIRPIFTANCNSCHGDPPTQQAPMSLTTLQEVISAVNDRNLLTRLNSASSPMPPAGRLPLATRQLIADWVDQGFPE
ncbi:hypothetical protein [Robiginitalea sediminis]|uniref:hypothetical protein n=1 Tax=Robiginitalea sediminis TaxID=1982593 RepID=UPI00117AE8B7|nr:hypothetical protein [Robiginitalea sediminis]